MCVVNGSLDGCVKLVANRQIALPILLFTLAVVDCEPARFCVVNFIVTRITGDRLIQQTVDIL